MAVWILGGNVGQSVGASCLVGQAVGQHVTVIEQVGVIVGHTGALAEGVAVWSHPAGWRESYGSGVPVGAGLGAWVRVIVGVAEGATGVEVLVAGALVGDATRCAAASVGVEGGIAVAAEVVAVGQANDGELSVGSKTIEPWLEISRASRSASTRSV